jgi:hypothetical protein
MNISMSKLSKTLFFLDAAAWADAYYNSVAITLSDVICISLPHYNQQMHYKSTNNDKSIKQADATCQVNY